jgi:hypothetical protein
MSYLVIIRSLWICLITEIDFDAETIRNDFGERGIGFFWKNEFWRFVAIGRIRICGEDELEFSFVEREFGDVDDYDQNFFSRRQISNACRKYV